MDVAAIDFPFDGERMTIKVHIIDDWPPQPPQKFIFSLADIDTFYLTITTDCLIRRPTDVVVCV